MKKSRLLVLLIILTICITGCGKNEKNNASEVSSSENINKDVNYNELYYNKLIERHNNNDYENYGTYYKEVQWTMIDLTKDEIPELVLYFEGDCSACKYMEFYTIKDNNVKELYFSNGDKKDSKIDGFTDIYNYDNNYYVYAFNQGYGWFGKINVDGEKISFEKVASMNAIFDIEYENKELYENIQKNTNKIKFKLKKEFIVNKSEGENNNNNNNKDQKTKSGLKFNKFYVDVYNENPKKSLSKEEIWAPYLKFLDDNKVEINYACYGEGMCQYKTTFESYFEKGDEFIKIYETSEMEFMCSEGKGYALLKVENNKLSIITSDENNEGLDMTGVREYKLYEE